MKIQNILILLLTIVVLSYNYNIYPPVQNYHLQNLQPIKIHSSCQLIIADLKQLFQFNHHYYWNKLVKRYENNKLCSQNQSLIQIYLHKNTSLKQQAYMINITSKKMIHLHFSTNSGYVYALESLFQLIYQGSLPIGTINDEPIVSHRGIMIDTARHFINITIISRLVESMPINKLNILHWHMVDDQSFPIQLQSHPQLANYSKYSTKQFYSVTQIKELIALAQKNAVKIIPELDSPSHTYSWGLSSVNSKVMIKCSNQYHYGQLDVSLAQTYNLTKDIWRQIDDIFKNSPYVHLGGDQVSDACWDSKPSIKVFMLLKNIKNYGELQMYWKYQIKKNVGNDRKFISWFNKANGIVFSDEDIMQFWGTQEDLVNVTSTSNCSLVLSPMDLLYLNTGQGFVNMKDQFGNYSVWKKIYLEFNIFPEGVNRSRILGAEVCLWGEVSNQDQLETNLWMRASAFAGAVWNEKKQDIAVILKSLLLIQDSFKRIGVSYSPTVSQYCQINPDNCFPPSSSRMKLEEQ